MDVIIEYKYINPEKNEILKNINETTKGHIEKYGIDLIEKEEHKYNIQFFDMNKNETKNISTKNLKKLLSRQIIDINLKKNK